MLPRKIEKPGQDFGNPAVSKLCRLSRYGGSAINPAVKLTQRSKSHSQVPHLIFKDPWLSAPSSQMVWLCRRTKPIFSDWESLVNQNLNLFYLIEQNMEAFEGPIRKAMILTELWIFRQSASGACFYRKSLLFASPPYDR
jgi:hypothetical protein